MSLGTHSHDILDSNSAVDLDYGDHELNRGLCSVSATFAGFGFAGKGLLKTALLRMEENDTLHILDAGCGTGDTLVELKDEVIARGRVPEYRVLADGITLKDYSGRFGWRQGVRERIEKGFINIRLGNLATLELTPNYYDVAVAHQVLMHNHEIRPIVSNVLASLRSGGVFFCDTLPEQQPELGELIEGLDSVQWEVDMEHIRQVAWSGAQDRVVSRFQKLN